MEEQKGPGARLPARGMLEKAEAWLGLHSGRIFRWLCLFTVLVSLLLFNARISEGGDDSAYIFAGFKYAKDFFNYYYSNNAPLYPLFLALPISLFGLNLAVLKFTSLIFYFFSFFFFYKAFRNRVPYLVLFPALLFYTFNARLQYFSSETFNESFFLFFQSLLFFCFFRLMDKGNDPGASLRAGWRSWLACGLIVAALSLTKNLGVVAFPVVIFFFLVLRQWKNAVFIAVSAAAVRLLYELFSWLAWGSPSQFAAQSEMFLKKDSYNPEAGNVDLAGLVQRFFGNCNLYFSRRIPQALGFQDTTLLVNYPHWMTVCISASVGLLLLAVLVAVVRSGNRSLLFALLFTGALVVASFMVLQVTWGQLRFIMIHLPVILLAVFFALHSWLRRFQRGYLLYFSVVVLLSASMFIGTLRKAAASIPETIHHLGGDAYYGFTPDWQHFLKMSRWCADHLPPDAVVASRKAGMSFLYGKGKEFFPINKVLFIDPVTHLSDPDRVLDYFKANNIRYVMLASLRYNPEKKDGITINTMTLLLMQVVNKYPNRIKLVYREGEEDDEPCYLYEILI